MINFRFHIVSLTAVLLSLGIGLVLGTAFLDDALISTLRSQLDGLETDLDNERERSSERRATITQMQDEHDALDGELGRLLLAEGMTDESVLVITRAGVDDTLVERTLAGLSDADADVVGVWEFTSDMALAEEDQVERLAEALDVTTDDGDRLRENVVNQLGDVLYGATDASASAVGDVQSLADAEGGPDGPTRDDDGPMPPEPDGTDGGPAGSGEDTGADDSEAPNEPHEPILLAALQEAGFVDYQLPGENDADAVELPAENLRVIVVDGADADLSSHLLFDVLGRLASNGPVPVVVAGPASTVEDDGERDVLSPLVTRVREHDELPERISTVDNLHRAPGTVATVLASMAARPGQPDVDAYGQGEGAERLLPARDSLPAADD